MDIELHEITPANTEKYRAVSGLVLATHDDACAECMGPVEEHYAIAAGGTGYWYLCLDCARPALRPTRVDYFGKHF